MGTIHRLLERLGFVRLRDFGLILTEDRRVVTTRSWVLDDGFGTCVVGWQDGDLAAAALERWSGAEPRPDAKPVAIAPPPRPRPAAKPAAVAPPPPAPPAPPEEDEWEWEIAVARARATEPAPAPAPRVTEQWLAPEPPTERWCEDDEPTRAAARSVGKIEVRASAPAIEPPAEPGRRTIIPVPSMPVVDARLVRPLDDSTRRMPPAPRRFPRSTKQQAAEAPDDYTSPTVASLPARASKR